MINPLSGAFVYCSLMIIIVFSIILLIYDYRDDKKEMIYIEMTEAEKVQKELEPLYGLKGKSAFGLAWFITSKVFPFFEMVYIYDYSQPRFIRFVIQMISMLVSLLFTILPYYAGEFTYREVLLMKGILRKKDGILRIYLRVYGIYVAL